MLLVIGSWALAVLESALGGRAVGLVVLLLLLLAVVSSGGALLLRRVARLLIASLVTLLGWRVSLAWRGRSVLALRILLVVLVVLVVGVRHGEGGCAVVGVGREREAWEGWLRGRRYL